MRDWTEFGIRELPVMSTRTRVELTPALHRFLDPTLAAIHDALAVPLRGITDGHGMRRGLQPLRVTGVPTAPILDAANSFVSVLSPLQREQMTFPLEADERRMWFNVHMNFFRHGLMLEDLRVEQRDAFVGLMAATLSARGLTQARDVMRINGMLADVTGSPDEYGEWPYFVSFFGTPTADGPWGWQLDGHHLAINCLVLGDELVLTPTFMGSEPCKVATGLLAGTQVFAHEQQVGLDLIRALDPGQRERAVQYASIMPGQIPAHLEHFIDGRMQAGAFKDNAEIGYCGVRADGFSDAQRALARVAIGAYVGWTNDKHAAVKMADVDAHLDETWFCWMGGTGPEDPFYYRLHSPVVLIEFDHHPGVAFDNAEPSHHHIHTVIRMPNGGDYGVDLLAHHHAHFDHANFDH